MVVNEIRKNLVWLTQSIYTHLDSQLWPRGVYLNVFTPTSVPYCHNRNNPRPLVPKNNASIIHTAAVSLIA